MNEAHGDLPSGFDVFDDAEVMRILAHPMRMRIFQAAARRPVSAKEIAGRLGQPVDRVSYHFRTLGKAGLIKPVRRTRRRGATETHYRAIASFDLSGELERAAPREIQHLMGKGILADVAADLETAVDRGASEEDEFRLARAHFVATGAGLERLRAECDAFYMRLAALERELAEELEAADDDAERYELNIVLGLYRGEVDELSQLNGPIAWWRGHGTDPPPMIGAPAPGDGT